MPLERRGRMVKPRTRSLDLPPPYRLVVLREAGDAFAHALANAAQLGAGTLVFVGRFDLAEFAVVLEPDEPLRSARRAFYAGMVAIGDTLAAKAPPETPIAIEWPDALHVDGGLVGGGRLGCPEASQEGAVPDWLVFGGIIRIAALGGDEPGLHPGATALEAEGFGDLGAEQFVEGFARHLMIVTDRWQESGFASVAADYLSRLRAARDARLSIGENGDLLVRRPGAPNETRALQNALALPTWLDRETGAPRL
jgi:biotin-(acetyl-CoA carboxylase) ligase